jgi:DNA-binding beta-propeller fold protein YncE
LEEAVMTARATSAAQLGVLVVTALCAAFLLASCGTSGSGSTVASPTGGTGGVGDVISETTAATPSTAATPAAAVDRAEIERRLALPRFTYVGETDYQGASESTGALAIIDSATDTLAFRPRLGSDLGRVAVAPDGRLLYVTDGDEPVLWVVDAETHEKVRGIRLPGVSPSRLNALNPTSSYTRAQLLPCSSAVACTPDGALVLVLDKAGLQVIDTASSKVVRTLPELRDGTEVAVSFDGTHAYIATTDALTRGKRTLAGWNKLFISGVGGGLALLDLKTWNVVKRISCGEVGGIAVDPDDSRFFCSDFKLRALRIVDPATLADLAVVPLKSKKATTFLPTGVGVLPDGSKVYVVCADSLAGADQCPEEYFCAVVNTESQEVVKRIPLDAY